jgi:hypothetical protein
VGLTFHRNPSSGCIHAAEVLMSRPFSHQWKELARETRQVLKEVPEGQREQKMRELAGGRDVNTLRRALSAFEFLQRWTVEHPAGAADLEAAPQSIVEIVSRWARFDEKSALAAARRWSIQRTPFDQFNREMKLARNQGGAKPGKTIENEYRAGLVEMVERLASETFSGDLTRPAINYKEGDDPVVDFRFLEVDPLREPQVRSIACLIIGPYRNTDLYKKRRQDWMCKAYALAWTHDVVLLMLPDISHIDLYERGVSDFTRRAAAHAGARQPSSRVPDIRIIGVFSAEDEAALASLASS